MQICNTTKFYSTSTLVSHTTQELVRDRFEFRRVDRVAVKGKTEGVDVFELLTLKGDIPVNLRKLMEVYENGLAAYFKRDWKFAATDPHRCSPHAADGSWSSRHRKLGT